MSLSFSPFDWTTDLTGQRRLFSECFPENAGLPPETQAFYHRKFRSLPHDPPSYEFVAGNPVEFVGYYAALPYGYRVSGNRFLCGMVCDVMTSPRMQGKGVFTKLGAYSLGQLADSGLDFVTGYPRRPSVIPGHLKVGWKIAFRLPMYLMPLRADGILKTKGLTGLSAPVNMALKAAHGLLSMRRKKERLTLEIQEWQSFIGTEEAAAFLEAWVLSKAIALEKTPEFLRWRLSIQEVDYRVVIARKSGKLAAVSIVRACRPEGVPALAVLDLMCLEDDPSLLRLLRQGWLDLAQAWSLEAVLMMMSEYHARRLRIWRLGFLRTPTVFSFIIQNLSERAKAQVPVESSAWHVMWIDSDDL